MKKKKLAFVINYFYPDLASTGQLMTELCLELQNDFEITVIAAQPGYAGEKNNHTRIFEEEYLENIKVVRIKLPLVNKTSKMSRMKFITTYFALANIALLCERKVDIIYTISQPPVLGGMIGTIGKFLKRADHVYNIQDFNPEQAAAIAYTKNKAVFQLAKAVDKLNCRYADHIVLVGEDMSETLKKRFGHKNVPAYSVINNWTDESEIMPLDKKHLEVARFLKEHHLEGKFIVMYSGNIGLYYDLEKIIQVLGEFKDNQDMVFLFIGEGAVKQQLMDYAKLHQLKNMIFLPYQPKEFIRYSLNAADVHLVVNQKGIKGVSVPSKIYGVMAAGRPILGVLEQGSEAERLISESGSGIIVEPQDYNEIISAIHYFYHEDRDSLNKMGLNGRKYLEAHLRKETSIGKYRGVLESV